MNIDSLVLLAIALPLMGAAFNGLVGLFAPGYRSNKTLIGTLGTLCVAIPFAIGVLLFIQFDHDAHITRAFTWMSAGDFTADFGYRVDQLSLLMMLIVTGVGALIHIYSIGYMRDDPGFWKFFAYLNLFIFAMLNLVLGDNLLVLFLGWEGVGLCSYLLIGFWFTDLKNSEAANKAFIVNRIGDFAFLLAMFILFKDLGSLDFDVILAGGASLAPATINWVVFLLFIGATGKSAQIPLFVWLPDAMAGPTPVSALIHAATMVTSGLYLLARMSSLVLLAPGVMTFIAIIGALTAIMAATIAITQNDIKRVLAYSTVSQLGFMFMAAGVGAFFVAIFHVMTHAFFKGCLFLGSGSVIHGMHEVEHQLEEEGHEVHLDPQDMRTMGGLRKYMPATSITYLISTLAIAGFPLMSGFFSKDEILFKAFEYGYSGNGYAWFVWVVGIITALLTAFYMMRSYVLTFRGKERWPNADRIHPHESPASMTGPLWALAVLAIVGGFLGLPGVIAHGDLNWIHHWLGAPYGGPVAEAVVAEHEASFIVVEWILLILGGVIALVGLGYAWRVYNRDGIEFDQKLAIDFRGLYTTWANKYYWDEGYDKAVVKPVLGLARRVMDPFDRYIVDGLVNGLGSMVRAFSSLFKYLQTGVVQNYAVAILFGVVLLLGLIIFG
ncbi:MAG: NADH-quinone oxidoreductase subunit L [Rhodothermales bacterium]|nr:NADH-quinone oxidoreductase subunit L [Rhodothermales bacterium]